MRSPTGLEFTRLSTQIDLSYTSLTSSLDDAHLQHIPCAAVQLLFRNHAGLKRGVISFHFDDSLYRDYALVVLKDVEHHLPTCDPFRRSRCEPIEEAIEDGALPDPLVVEITKVHQTTIQFGGIEGPVPYTCVL